MSKFDAKKHTFKRESVLKDTRTVAQKFKDKIRKPFGAASIFFWSGFMAVMPFDDVPLYLICDVLLFYNLLYFTWLIFLSRTYNLPFKMPKSANKLDPNNKVPGTSRSAKAEGILYIGNEEKTNEEIWFTNSDARTHILYLGTTGAGKTEGLKALATNALGWGSGFIFVDGKADTDLWGSLSALARRFGRDDDLLVLNYMTGNSENKIPSNTINPFSRGSASYLVNLLVSLMPEVQGDNAMWKDRAVALVSALMPVLTWQRNNQEKPLNITTISDALNFKKVIELSRRPEIPENLRKGVRGYLDTLPGYADTGFNDDGTEKPPAQGAAPMDYGTIYQQHGYLAMQFTRQLQSLSGDYGYIFQTPSADIDMMDVVLNRRILVVLIPALEKSSDETANLGKIVGSMLKGMMGATLGSGVEGDTDMVLENKPTRSNTPFMAVFDEVGYYTTPGMGVMAAQARSLGFCLVFAGQDLPAMEKRVKEEARSIVANCNLKIFGKLEDPTQTKEFFEKTVGEMTVLEASNRKQEKIFFGMKKFADTENYSITSRAKANYDQLKAFKEGQAVVTFGDKVVQTKMFYSSAGKIKSLRVNKFITLAPIDPDGKRGGREVDNILERMRDKGWTAANADTQHAAASILTDAIALYAQIMRKQPMMRAACAAVTQLAMRAGLTAGPAKPSTAPQTVTASAPPVLTAAQPLQEAPALRAEPRDAVPVMATPAAQPAAPPRPAAPITPPERQLPAEEHPALPAPNHQPALEAGKEPGLSETVKWTDLLHEKEPVPVAATTAAPKPVAPSAPAPPPASDPARLQAMPDASETVKWTDLLQEKEAVPVATPAPPPMAPLPTGGFGTGFGTGFGGFGGLSPIGFQNPGSIGLTGVPAEPPKETLPPEKIEKAVEEGQTIKWDDLV